MKEQFKKRLSMKEEERLRFWRELPNNPNYFRKFLQKVYLKALNKKENSLN